MKKVLSMLLAALVAFSAMLAYATVPAFADDEDDDDEVALRLNILAAFFAGITEIELPEDVDLFVQHGWGFGDPTWADETPEAMAAALSDNSRFDLLVDGEPEGPDEETFEILPNGVAAKLFLTEVDDGEAGESQVFTGIWTIDSFFLGGPAGEAVVVLVFDLTVHFVGDDDDD